MNKLLFPFLLFLLWGAAAPALAIEPGKIYPVSIGSSSDLDRIQTTLESTVAAQYHFAITVDFKGAATPYPLWFQVTAPDGPAGYSYLLNLQNLDTKQRVIRDVKTSPSARSTHAAKVWIDPSATYLLTVSAPPSQKLRNWLGLYIYRPQFWLYVSGYAQGAIVHAEYRDPSLATLPKSTP